jgi:hypothetical protein
LEATAATAVTVINFFVASFQSFAERRMCALYCRYRGKLACAMWRLRDAIARVIWTHITPF